MFEPNRDPHDPSDDPAPQPDPLHGVTDRDGPRVERSEAESARARAFAIETARLLNDYRCEQVIVFDVRQLSEIADFLVIGTGTSERQIKSVAGYISELGREQGFERFGSQRDDASTWAVLDFVEVIVHLFEPETRAHYDLEMLWDDAPRLDWQRE